MLKIPNLTDLQGKLDAAIAKNGVSDYVEYAKYLPQDAAPPADATHVLGLRSLKTGGKVEIALKAHGATVEMLANIGLDVL